MRSPRDDCLQSSLTEVHATDEMFGTSSYVFLLPFLDYSSPASKYTESGLKAWKTFVVGRAPNVAN